jgi:competence protein ComEA
MRHHEQVPTDWDDDDEAGGAVARIASWLVPSPAEARGLVMVLTVALVVTGALLAGALRREVAPPVDAAVVAAAGSAGPALGVDGTAAQTTDESDAAAPASAPGSVPGAAPLAVVVHVTGAVATPGLVTLGAGARVGDAVAAAGGLDPEADLVRVNLARMLTDGEHVHVPRVGEDPVVVGAGPGALAADGSGGPGPGSDASGARSADGRLDVNRASAAELETLPGIGPAKAAAIVSDRERNGPFRVPGDLRRVSGIGEATFQRIAELIVVG